MSFPAAVTHASTDSDLRAVTGSPLCQRAHIFVTMSCASPLDAPSRHAIEGLDEVHIGRGPAREAVRGDEIHKRRLTLTLADRHVSSAHARVVRREGVWMLEDLGSKNGSLVNGAPSRAAPPADG